MSNKNHTFTDMEFIEVRRIVTDKKGTLKIVPETMCIQDIKTFRPWYNNGSNSFKGEATLLVLKSVNRVTGQSVDHDKEKEDLPTMMIEENYSDFLKRMSGRVIIFGKQAP